MPIFPGGRKMDWFLFYVIVHTTVLAQCAEWMSEDTGD
jgi:hypothetical protein